jgi:glycosyltransferase involved in cell wall biosynthesis
LEQCQLKILHLACEKTWRGGENQLRLLIEGLTKRGIESHVATLADTPTATRLGSLVPTVTVRRAGYHPSSAYQLSRYVLNNNITILDAHTSQTHSLALLVKWFAPTLKLVVHRRVDNPIKSNPLTLWKYRTPLVDHYVPISDAIKRILVSIKIPESKITTVKSAVEIPSFNPSAKMAAKKHLGQRFGVDPHQVFLGNASALDLQKDPVTLLEACRNLNQKNIPFHCFLAGDGPLASQLRQQILDLGLSQRVTLLGFEENVPEFLLGLDILAFPSINEGLGTVLLDALAAGCAVVATDVGGIPEIIVDQKTGLLVPPKDTVKLAEGIERLLFDDGLAARLASQGLKHIKANFSLDSMVDGNLKVYQRLLNEDTLTTA